MLSNGLTRCHPMAATVATRSTTRLPKMNTKTETPILPSALAQIPITQPNNVLASCRSSPDDSTLSMSGMACTNWWLICARHSTDGVHLDFEWYLTAAITALRICGEGLLNWLLPGKHPASAARSYGMSGSSPGPMRTIAILVGDWTCQNVCAAVRHLLLSTQL